MKTKLSIVLGLLILLACTISAQQTIVWFSLADVAGSGAVVPLSATSSTVRLCQLVAPVANASVVQWGDAAITAARGARIAPGGGQFLPPGGSSSNAGSPYVFDLAQTYVLVQAGDKLTVTCAR